MGTNIQLSLPNTKEIRQRIEGIHTTPHRNAFKYQYLTGTRATEVCGLWHIRGTDFQIQKYEDHPIIIFSQRTAKRNGRIRLIAIPLEPQYEPWAEDLREYFERNKNRGKVFRFTTRTLRSYGSKLFKGISYPIEKYQIKKTIIQEHIRSLVTHGLRHIRATELITKYLFDQIDLIIFFGWKFSSSMKTSTQIDRYIYVQYARYLPKLLKPFS